LLAYALRTAIDRPRPPVVYPEPKPLVHVPHGGSFPSGHAATSFACATMLALIAPRYAAAFFVLAAAIAWSRVYNGVHYPLDVVGGAALGVFVAIALRWLLKGLPRSRRARPVG
jgi:undecaprenyl-diphosphatase